MTFLNRIKQMQRYHLNQATTTVSHILPTSLSTSHPFTYNINIIRRGLQAIPVLGETVYPRRNFSYKKFKLKNQHLRNANTGLFHHVYLLLSSWDISL